MIRQTTPIIDELSQILGDVQSFATDADNLTDQNNTAPDVDVLEDPKNTVSNKITEVQDSIDTATARKAVVESEIEDLENDPLLPYYPYLQEDLNELKDEKDQLDNQLTALGDVADSVDGFSDSLDGIETQLNSLGIEFDGISNITDKIGDVTSDLRGIEDKLNGITDSLGSACGIPDLIKDIVLQKIKTLAKKFAAEKSLLIARKLAAAGTPTGPLGNIVATASQLNALRAEVEAKIDQIKGVISTVESLKDEFEALLNGNLSIDAVLGFAEKWGTQVPGLGGYVEQGLSAVNQLQNFDVCSLLPNIIKNPLTGEFSEEPRDAVATTEDPTPAKKLEPTVVDKAEEDAETIPDRYPSPTIEEKKQKVLQENFQKFNEEWEEFYSKVEEAHLEKLDALEALKDSETYKLLIKKSNATGAPISNIVGYRGTDAERSFYAQFQEAEIESELFTSLYMDIMNLRLHHETELTARKSGYESKSGAIEKANSLIASLISSGEFFKYKSRSKIVTQTNSETGETTSGIQEPDKYFENGDYGLNRANEAKDILEKWSSELYDYYNYSDHYKG